MKRQIAIGVDVGGTKIAAATVDLNCGSIINRHEIQTRREQGGERVLNRLYNMVRDIYCEAIETNAEILGVGIGVPELVDNAGRIQSDWNFDWSSRDVAQRLHEFGQIKMESDARTAALAESYFGHGAAYSSFLCVTVGTGLSSAFCCDGKIHRGANGFAIHFASSDIMALCQQCGAQTPFNLEALASGRGLVDTLSARTGNVVNAQAIVEGSAGTEGTTLLTQSIAALASYLGQLINLLDPHAVIICGGLGTAPRVFSELEIITRRFIWAEKGRAVPIVCSALGSDGGVIGAAALFREDTNT